MDIEYREVVEPDFRTNGATLHLYAWVRNKESKVTWARGEAFPIEIPMNDPDIQRAKEYVRRWIFEKLRHEEEVANAVD